MDENDPLADELSQGMREAFFGAFNRLKKPTSLPERLYHFTDTAGLLGVIEGRTLWASLSTCLNDASEVAAGRQRVLNLLESKLKTQSSGFLRHTKAFLNDCTIMPYVTCFCASADQALHWLHYGRSGSGVALGFEPSGLLQNDDLFLQPVSYDGAEFDARLDELLKSFEQVIARFKPLLTGGSGAGLERSAAQFAAVVLAGFIPFFKNPAFKAEHEWRLAVLEMEARWVPEDIVPAPKPRNFRATGGRAVPYRRLTYGESALPLSEIVLGYSAAMAPDDPGLSVFLKQCLNQKPPVVRRTDIPVRS